MSEKPILMRPVSINDYRMSIDPVPSKREMARRMGIAWATYLKYEDKGLDDGPLVYRLAAWAVASGALGKKVN